MIVPLPTKTAKMKEEMQHVPTAQYAYEIIQCMTMHDGALTADTALEIGAAWGVSTLAILETNEVCHLTSVDSNNCPRAHEEVEVNGHQARWEFVLHPSINFWKVNKLTYGLIMVDGDHGYDGCSLDLNQAWQVLNEGGLLIADDYVHPHNKTGEYGVSLAVLELLEQNRNAVVSYRGSKVIGITKRSYETTN